MFRFKKKEKIRDPFRSPETYWHHYGWQWSLGEKKRMQPRVFGHKAGMEALQEVTIAAKIWEFRS